MTRKDLRFDAARRADENDLVTEIGGDARERERRHEVTARAAARDEELHGDCGLRIADCGFEILGVPTAINNSQSSITLFSRPAPRSPRHRWRPAQRSTTIAHTT